MFLLPVCAYNLPLCIQHLQNRGKGSFNWLSEAKKKAAIFGRVFMKNGKF